jgi:myo-inositol-1(or 4)-monophosphatase
MDSQTELLSIAIQAAKVAAAPLKQAVAGYRTIKVEEAHDVKLQADIESERKIREHLVSASSYPIIGEEEGGDPRLWEGEAYYWVVDPLDGTYNYLREYPECCVSVGLMKGKTPVCGVIYNFNTDTLYTGGPGLPLQINGRDHTPNWAESADKACIATGFPHEMKRDESSMVSFINLILNYKKVRMIGSAALAMTYVTTGYFDLYYETGVKLWDIAAGLSLAASAGATTRLKHWEHKPLHFDIWTAGRPEFIPGD